MKKELDAQMVGRKKAVSVLRHGASDWLALGRTPGACLSRLREGSSGPYTNPSSSHA